MQPILCLPHLLELIVCSKRLYIIDEHQSVRLALAERLQHSCDLQIIGHTGNAEEAIREVQENCVDIVLLEVKRSDGLGLELLRQLSTLTTPPKIVVLTSYPSFWERQAASRAGATSYLLKDIETEDLIQQIIDLE
jgi:two-component system response regulator DevR